MYLHRFYRSSPGNCRLFCCLCLSLLSHEAAPGVVSGSERDQEGKSERRGLDRLVVKPRKKRGTGVGRVQGPYRTWTPGKSDERVRRGFVERVISGERGTNQPVVGYLYVGTGTVPFGGDTVRVVGPETSVSKSILLPSYPGLFRPLVTHRDPTNSKLFTLSVTHVHIHIHVQNY